jgi:hypothetical protein
MGLAFRRLCDGNGRPDVFVANDTVRNFLFHHDENEKFPEPTLTVGVTFNEDGVADSGTGAVDFRAVNTDGKPDYSSRHSRTNRFRCIVIGDCGFKRRDEFEQSRCSRLAVGRVVAAGANTHPGAIFPGIPHCFANTA